MGSRTGRVSPWASGVGWLSVAATVGDAIETLASGLTPAGTAVGATVGSTTAVDGAAGVALAGNVTTRTVGSAVGNTAPRALHATVQAHRISAQTCVKVRDKTWAEFARGIG
jgi:hypothetical protein